MEKDNKSKKSSILWAFAYFILGIGVIVSSTFLFRSRYYTQIFVSGNSMAPTLNGNISGRVDYGLADTSSKAISYTNRFDVVVTTYPIEWSKGDDESWKIKRVWGLPNETIKLQAIVSEKDPTFSYMKFEAYEKKENEAEPHLVFSISSDLYKNEKAPDYVTYHTYRKSFSTMLGTNRSISEYTLKEDEYFLMGDNWSVGGSSDSYTNAKKGGYVALSNLKGVVISLEGTGKVKTENDQKILYDKKPYTPRYFF